MSKMGELHHALHSAKVLFVCVCNPPPEPAIMQKFSGSHADKAWAYYQWAERNWPSVCVEIRDGHNKRIIGRDPINTLPYWELERLDRECARLS